MVSMKKQYRHQVSNKTLKETPPKFSDRSFKELVNAAFKEDRLLPPRSRDLGCSRQRQQEVSTDREIVCSRGVIIDSEFNARKGEGERPDPPSCFCAIEITQDGRVIEHRLAAPYPANRRGIAAILFSPSDSRSRQRPGAC